MMEVQMNQLRDQVHRREAEISTLKQHLALLTSDFKYNLKLLEDRDFELDQTEAQLEQIKNVEKQKETEMELLNSEIVNFKARADQDAEQIRSLESTLSQYKESVRSVRERLEEALQLRDQELTCHRSELEALKTKIHQQSESLKVQEKGLSDAMKACERSWSQRYSECHKTVMTLVAEQESLLKEKLAKDREMEIMQNRVLELQKSVDELTGVTDVSRKECTILTGQLEILQERANTRVRELDEEKQSLERNLRKKILEEYDGKIAELLAQLQSIEYAVSLERREANTRLITMEAQQVEKITSLHQTIQELRGERNDLLDKVGNLEKELASLKENLYHLKNNGKRFSQKEEILTKEVSTLQHSLHEAKLMLGKSEVKKTHEIVALHDSLREARSKEKLLSDREAEQTKRIGILEQLLEDARSKMEQLSKKDSDEKKELRIAQEALDQTKKELYMISDRNSEQLKEIATLKKSLTEARNQGAMLSRTQAEHTEELAFLKQSLYDARNHGETMARKYGENSKDLENLRQLLNAARTQEDLMRKKLDDQEKEIVTLQEALLGAKADGELLMKSEASHTEEISALHSTLAETQKQADAAFKHAQHLNAIFEVTQAESRRRVEIKECVSSLITSAQNQQESFCRHNTEFSNSPCELATRNMDDGKEFDSGCDNTLMGFSSGCKIRTLPDTGLKTHMGLDVGLEEENRFLKARVEELQGENFKVGRVISELRNELETVGLLQPSTGCDLHGFASQPQNVVNFAPSEENISSQRQAKMPSGSTWKNDSHEAILRSKAVDTFQEKEDISLTEKEELLTLRALLKDVHNRNALFHKQVVSISVPAEKMPERRAELDASAYKSAGRRDLTGGSSKRTTHIDRHVHPTLGDTPRFYKDKMRTSVGQPTGTPPTFIADDPRGLPEPRSKQSTAEAKSSLGVSAEVLKLNEQIARVRQQLTSLCSSDQSISSCQKSSEEQMPRSKSRYSGKSAHTDEPFGSASHENKAGENSGVAPKNKGELHHRNFLAQHHKEAQQDKIAEKAPRSAQHDFHRREEQELDLEQPATKRSNRKPQVPDAVQSSEVFLPTKNSASKMVRPSARDCLGTRARAKVGRKIRVKVPSVTSSRSDVVCSHCQECISDEDCQSLLSPSPVFSYTESPKPNNAKERDGHRCSPWAHGHASVFTSFGSDEKEPNHDVVRKSQPQTRTWTDTDESDPASIIQHTCTVHPHDKAHADRRKPSRKVGRGRRDVTREISPRAKSHAAKEENLLRKQSTTERKTGSGTVSTPRSALKVERSTPAIVRERVLSQQDPNHSKISTSRAAKIY